MTQNASDVEIANQGFAAFRQDLNDVLEDITTLHSGNTAPTTTYASMWWYEEDTDKLYIRNEDNDAWIEILTLDQANDHLASLGATITLDGSGNASIDGTFDVNGNELILDADGDTSITADTDDRIDFKTGGTDAMHIDASQNVGIGTNSPTVSGSAFTTLNIKGSAFNTGMLTVTSNDLGSSAGFYSGNSSSDNPAIMYQNDLRIGSTTDTGLAGFAERARFLSSGGITFNGDTAAANALDDYEEGTWTPTLGGSSSNPTVTYSSLRSGTYVKIGKLVYCTFIMDIASCSGGSGIALISGLPYTVENSNASYGNQPILIDRLAGDYRQVSSQTEPNQSYVTMIRNAGSTGSHAGVDVSTLANMSCRGTIIYRAS